MTGRQASLLRRGVYSLAWAKDFYDQTSTWWGSNTCWASHRSRAAAIGRLAGPGPKRILERIEVDDRKVSFDDVVSNGGSLLDAWQYVVKLAPAGRAGRAG
jgi:hypothetical protein